MAGTVQPAAALSSSSPFAPGTAAAAASSSAVSGSSGSSGRVAAPQRPMTLAQRHAQVSAERGGLSPLLAAARNHPVTRQTGMPKPATVKSVPAGPWSKAAKPHAVASPMTAPPPPDTVNAYSSVLPGEITFDLAIHIPSGTAASSLQEFAVLVYDTSGNPVYTQEVPRSTDPSTYTGESGGYCYGWWNQTKYPNDWCFWAMGNVPGGTLHDGSTYFAQVLFEDTAGNFSDTSAGYSGEVTVFYTPDIPGAQAGLCTCYAQNSGGDPVNTATGVFYQQATDAKLVGAGTPFSLTRSYRSDRTAVGLLGAGWSLPYDAKITTGTGAATLTESDGSQITFTQNSNGTYSAPAGVRLTLVKTSSGWTVTALDHTSRQFNSSGQLVSILDASGHGLTLAYASGRLSTVTDTAGRVVTFTLNSSGLVTKVALPDGRSVGYGYTGNSLTSVTDLRGGTTAYTYDSSGRLLTIKDALGHVVTTNTYDATTGRVTSQTDGMGAKTTFAWNATTQESDRTDPNGGVWSDLYSGNVLMQSIDPFGNSVSYTYDQALNQTGITDRLGNTTTMTYDGAGNMLTRTAPAPLSYTESWTYDSAGDVTSHTDANGHKTSYTYDSLGRLTSTTDPNGGVAKQTYTSLGEQATTVSPRGETTTYGYDSAGNRTSVTTAAGEKTTFTYDTAGRVLTKTDPRGNVSGANTAAYTTTYTYNAADLIASSKDPAGNTTTFGYDADGRQTTATDPSGKTTTTAYDADGRVTSVTDPNGKVQASTYDANGNLLSSTDGHGDKTTYTYDKANRRVTMVAPQGNVSGGTPSAYTTTYGYDANGNQTSVTGPTGAVTTTAYDVLNRPVTVTDPLGHATTTAYDGDGHVTKTTDPLSHSTSATYDALGHVLTTTDALGHTTTFAYDADGNRVSQSTALGEKTTWTYDQDERVATSVDPRGNVSGATPATYTTTYAYDAAGNRISVTDPLGDKSTSAYDGDNRQTSSIDPLGNTTSYGYDADSRLSSVTAPDGGVTSYGYDAAGNLTSRTDANNHATTFAYDGAHHLLSVTDPLGHTDNYTYDADGNVTVFTDARAQTTTTTFDARNLPTKVVYSDGTPSVTYTYDKAGQATAVTDAIGSRTLTYDTVGHLTAANGFSYVYDAAGNITSRTYPDGEKTTYTYNQDNEQTGQTADGATTSYTYDASGRLTNTTLPSTVGFSESRTYDASGRLTNVADTKPNGTGVAPTVMNNWILTLDAAGEPTNVRDYQGSSVPTQIGPTTAYTYDADGRVTTSCTYSTRIIGGCPSASTTSYTYDKVGNRLSMQPPSGAATTYNYNAADELTQSTNGTTSTTYGYDADGNQTAAGSNTFTYNPANQLTGATVGGTSYAFTNDAAGNRVTTTSGGSTTQTETWDINNALPQLATLTGAGGALIGDYHYDPLGQIQSEHSSGGAFYPTHDDLGSVTDLLSSAGVNQYAYSYDPFGNQSVNKLVSTAPAQPFGFTGQLEDQSVPGKVDLRARTYDPTTARFTGRDPIMPKTSDPYVAAYVYGDDAPTYLTDPSGKSPWSWLGNAWDQFSSGFVQGFETPFKFTGDLYDAFTGKNGGWSGFFDTYVPVRPAYRLFNIADILRQEGCPQLADLYESAGNQLASQIAVLGIGGLAGWERAAVSVDAGETAAASSAGAGGGWPTIGETPGGAIGQLTENSCINACGEMLNELLTQESTLGNIQSKAGWQYEGPGGLASELSKLDPGGGWVNYGIDKFADAQKTLGGVRYLSQKGPFAAQLKIPGENAHSIVVDGVDAAGNIMIRDPWDGGTTYTMTPNDFNKYFTGQVVFRQ